jgi:hypothetical protein
MHHSITVGDLLLAIAALVGLLVGGIWGLLA